MWEGRYKAHLVADDDHLLRCYRYIELNPVRAAMVAHPADYPWSSYGHNALDRPDPLIHLHPCYTRLGNTAPDRQQAYRHLVQPGGEEDACGFREHLRQQRPMGNDRFRAAIEAQLGRKLGPGKSGRPRKPGLAS